MLDGPTEGALELVLAIFRLAVADYLGRAYGHDEVGRPRPVRPRHRGDAEEFLRGAWAACLGDWINLSSATVWRRASQLACHASGQNPDVAPHQPELDLQRIAPRESAA